MRLKKTYVLIVSLCVVLLSPCMSVAKDKAKDFTVVIDAGHGGKDVGATDNGVKEKDINLGVALQLEELIRKKLKSAKVVMTRKDDTYLTLQERADKANKSKGDLFISIHTNSVDKKNKNRKTVSGSSVYALGLHKDDNNMQVARRENSVIELESGYEQKYSGFDPSKDESYIIFEMAQKKNLSKSIKFAEDVQKELVGIGRGNRGVHQAGFWVLWATSMPAVLVELDFICNPGSAQYMASDKGRKEMAEAIFKAVKKYESEWRRSQNNMASSRSASYEDGYIAEETSDGYDIGDTNVAVAKSSSGLSKKKTSASSSAKSSREDYAAARRRRRSEDGKAISESRSYETASIPLYTESQRKGSSVAATAGQNPDISDNVGSVKSENDAKDKKKEKKSSKKKKEKKRSANAHNAKVNKFVTVYKIQILASADLLKQNNPRFCGLSPITTYKENNLYKYYYGESSDKAEIDAMLKDVRKKIPDAFVVTSTKSMDTAKN